jgi:hypothetical protein
LERALTTGIPLRSQEIQSIVQVKYDRKSKMIQNSRELAALGN